MGEQFALTGARIFDGEEWHDDAALVVNDGIVEGVIGADQTSDLQRVVLRGGMLVPGFIDLQVNGGGGVQFNEQPGIAVIETICRTMLRFGTTACLPTLITDTAETMDRAVDAGRAAARQEVPGFLGLHLEGPHLSVGRRGAHDAALLRPFSDNDLQRMLHARNGMPCVLTTIAPEVVTPAEIAAIAVAGVVVAIGHSDATYDSVLEAASAGARIVTHVFNAQSQLGSREPGIVGAALDAGALSAGIIADGIHVHPAALGVAIRSKRGPGRVFLVSDAMAPVGTDAPGFVLNSRTVRRQDGAFRLADGTLAGADVTLVEAVRYVHQTVGVPLAEALRMASLYPAEAMGIDGSYGHLRRGARADMVLLSESLAVRTTWVGGREVGTQ